MGVFIKYAFSTVLYFSEIVPDTGRSGASRIRSRCRRHLSLFFFTNKLSKSHAADGYNINREHLNKKVKNVPYGVSAFSLSNKIVVVFDIICIRSFFSNARFL